ncbi:hypothetical protein GCM10009624_08630 [Gordonia sinesedis]
MSDDDALEVDPDALGALAARLAAIGGALDGLHSQLAAVLAEADVAIGTGRAADEFRRGFTPTASEGLDAMAASVSALDRQLTLVRQGLDTVERTDGELGRSFSSQGRHAWG